MVNQSTAIDLANNYVNAVEASGTHLAKAFLFGSFARNQQHEWSDIDIALISQDFIGVSAVDKEPFRVLQLRPEYSALEIHTFSMQSLKDGDPFLLSILSTGIELNFDSK
jgi:uncharacterized protein